MVAKINFEAVVPATTKNFIHHIMIEFIDKLELNDTKYQTNRT